MQRDSSANNADPRYSTQFHPQQPTHAHPPIHHAHYNEDAHYPAGIDHADHADASSDDEVEEEEDVTLMGGRGRGVSASVGGRGRGVGGGKQGGVASGKKTKGRVKIKMEFIDNKLRRYTTFSKRKTGIMKKVRGDGWRLGAFGGARKYFNLCKLIFLLRK